MAEEGLWSFYPCAGQPMWSFCRKWAVLVEIDSAGGFSIQIIFWGAARMAGRKNVAEVGSVLAKSTGENGGK